jgi:alpha-N-arabinofuranosidase
MAARGKDGIVRLALVNLDPDAPVDLTVSLPGLTLTSARGQILTAPAVTTLNTFENPDLVRPQPFVGAHVTAGVIGMRLPEKSVIVLELN